MQDAIAYVLIIAAVVLGGYLIIEMGVYILQVVFANQSAVMASPIP